MEIKGLIETKENHKIGKHTDSPQKSFHPFIQKMNFSLTTEEDAFELINLDRTNGIFFHRIRTNDSKICMKSQKIVNHQNNLEKEEQNYRYHVL